MPFKPAPVGGGLGQAQAALAPQDAGQFLDQMLLGRPLRRVLGHQRRDEGVVLVGILPRQHGVARQHAVAQRIEAGDLGAGGLGRQGRFGLVHGQKLLLRFGLSIRASSRSAWSAKASSARISASKARSRSRS